MYKRGGHAPCSCYVTLKKDDRSVGVDNCSTLGGGDEKGRRQFYKGTYSEQYAMIAVISSSDDVGIDSPTKFRGLRQMVKIIAIVAK
jgi:hypothetical protein